MIARDVCEVGFLGQVSADEPDDIFDGTSLPTLVGVAEVGPCAEHFIDSHMLGVLRAVVIGDGPPHMRWVSAQASVDGLCEIGSPFLLQLRQMNEASGTFQTNADGFFALSGNNRVRFPVTGLLALLDIRGTTINGNPVWNVAFSVFLRMPTCLALLMGSHQQRDQLSSFTHVWIVDVLIDRLVADAKLWMVVRQPAGDLLGGPPQLQLADHIASSRIVFQKRAPAGLALASLGTLLSLDGSIPIVYGGPIAPHFSTDRALVAAQSVRYFTEALTLGTHHCYLVSLFSGQVLVLVSHTLRIASLAIPSVALPY